MTDFTEDSEEKLKVIHAFMSVSIEDFVKSLLSEDEVTDEDKELYDVAAMFANEIAEEVDSRKDE